MPCSASLSTSAVRREPCRQAPTSPVCRHDDCRGINIQDRPVSTTAIVARPRIFWLTTGLGIAQICSWGPIFYSCPLIAASMRPGLGWTRPEICMAATVGRLLAALAAYPGGAAIDKGHGRRVMSTASVVVGLLMIAWSQLDDIWLFYLVFSG